MKTIIIDSVSSTGLDPSLARASRITVDDRPLGQGGFGVAYRVADIDGSATTPQVVKLLIDNGYGSAAKGLGTVRQLQRRLALEHTKLAGRPGGLIGRYPALYAVPQLSFTGLLEGRKVMGYCANDLGAAGFEDFSAILDDDAKARRFQQLPVDRKLRLAAQLVAAFDFLSAQVRFIHADIKAEALFVDVVSARCAVIDFDSGAVAQSSSDQPTTFGTRQDWLAPEIARQLDQAANGSRQIKVDLLSDVWSVNIAIHYLLTGAHPLFFLSEVSERSVDAYFRQFAWPAAHPRFPFFRREYATVYQRYVAFMRTRVPREVVERLAFSMNRGYREPTARTTYGQWRIVLGVVNRPEIRSFQADRAVVTDTQPVRLTWDVMGAALVELRGHGDVTARRSLDVTVTTDTIFELVVTTDSGSQVTRRLRVAVDRRVPTIRRFVADSSFLVRPQAVRLEWEIDGARRVVIDHGVGEISGRRSVEVSPRRDTMYTLTAMNGFGNIASACVVVRVSQAPPSIRRFAADSNLLHGARRVELSWDVSEDAETVVIAGIGAVSRIGARTLGQRRDTTYVISATSYFGVSATASVTVRVSNAPPVIESFRAVPPAVREGGEARIEWEVHGANAVRIDPAFGPVPALATRSLRPADDVRLRLVAESYYGVIAVRELELRIVRPTALRTDGATPLHVARETGLRCHATPLAVGRTQLHARAGRPDVGGQE